MDWARCLFCKNKFHVKVMEMLKVSTFEVCQLIEHAAESHCDEDMLHVLLGVSSELVAAEPNITRCAFQTIPARQTSSIKLLRTVNMKTNM